MRTSKTHIIQNKERAFASFPYHEVTAELNGLRFKQAVAQIEQM